MLVRSGAGGPHQPPCDDILGIISQLLVMLVEAETQDYMRLQELLARYFEWVEPPRSSKATARTGRRASVKSMQELHSSQQQVSDSDLPPFLLWLLLTPDFYVLMIRNRSPL